MNKSLVPPARLCGAAAGNFALRYIGKVCYLLLVRADYIRPRPRALPNGARGIAQAVTRHRPISKLKLKVESQTRGGGRTETKGRSRRCRGENRAAKRAGTRDVGGDGRRRGDRGSRQREGSVHQLQQATGRMAVIELAGRARRTVQSCMRLSESASHQPNHLGV